MLVARSILSSRLALKREVEIKIRGLHLTSFRTIVPDCRMPDYMHTRRRNEGGGFCAPLINTQFQKYFLSYLKSVRIVAKSAY